MSRDQNSQPVACDLSVEQQRALDSLKHNIRVLAAEIMRVAADAGDCHNVGLAVYASAEAYDDYRQTFGFFPSSDVLRSALNPEETWREFRPRSAEYSGPPHEMNMIAAKAKIKKGALRDLAGRYLNQLTHQGKGESLMMEGVREWNAA